MYTDITGIILSGGKSSRMGENKSFLKIGDKYVIEIIASLMTSLFQEVMLITNEPEQFKFLNLLSFKDIYPGKGPLAGIHSGLIHASNQKGFVISCDMLLVTREMIEYLANFKTSKEITVAKADGFIQQLCGLYDKRCIPAAEAILSAFATNEGRDTEQLKRKCSILRLIDDVGAEIINAEELPFYSKDLFFNMNRKDEYEYVRNRLMITKN
ncbi:MAG: molybdenum cofactor guanylyltransferase [Ignavibacteriales bacterium]